MKLGLSPRKLQLLRLVFDDMKEYTIAAELHLSQGTVHDYMKNLRAQLKVEDRTQLVLRVLAEFVALTLPSTNGPAVKCAFRAAGLCPYRCQTHASASAF